jgi:hypothetical protein
MSDFVTPYMLAAYTTDFLNIYVVPEKRENAAKALLNINKLYAIQTMAICSEEVERTMLKDIIKLDDPTNSTND